ncbi:hypothetical protein PWT90_01299 [Aphanocladium album]|nr:hypothetical protein PWT90_01299 [Aphanocladium album]
MDRSHASCFVLDSGTADADAILVSEAETAAASVQYQLQHGLYTCHHIKPVLVATMLRDDTSRLTQARFDGKLNKLVLHQS